jgi:cytochrome P450
VYLHPLRNVPGPTLSAFTTLPHFLAVSRGDVNHYLRRLHERYGKVVRIAPDELSFADLDALRDIYGYGTKGKQGRVPPKAFSRYPENVHISLLNEPNDAEHARVRRIFSPAFSARALTEQEPVFIRYTDQLVRVLQEKNKIGEKNAAVDLVKMCKCCKVGLWMFTDQRVWL